MLHSDHSPSSEKQLEKAVANLAEQLVTCRGGINQCPVAPELLILGRK